MRMNSPERATNRSGGTLVSKRFTTLATVAALALVGAVIPTAAAIGDPGGGSSGGNGQPSTIPGGFKHLVVIYEENHSFDNLYGGRGPVDGQGLNEPPHVTDGA